MSSLPVTPPQTVGPFFSPSLLKDEMNILVDPGSDGERIRIEGRVFDGDGAPVPDAVIEIWQANAHGRYNHPLDRQDLPLDPAFTGFGRCGTDDDGRFSFETVRPGRVPFHWDAAAVRPAVATETAPSSDASPHPDHEAITQAPHISVTVLARGLLHHLATRLYFDDDPTVPTDPVFQHVPEAARATLLAQRQHAEGIATYRFDIILQGEGETAFFDL